MRRRSAQTLELRYGHMNPPTSAAGIQAQMLADAIAKNTNGQIKVTVYPSSQLGKLQELAEAVSTGTIALSHNTAGGIGSLHEPFGALDTPYLYRDYDHLMKVMDVDSPVMKKLNEGLIKAAGVRVLYAYYFGTRQLTSNKPMLQPSDLAGQKIRAIPFPIYMTAVQGLGAIPIPVDWSEVPTALATGQVPGQENPVNVVLSSKLYETQSHLMLTGHIMNAQIIVINDKVWQKLDADAARCAERGGAGRAQAGERNGEEPGIRRDREAQGPQDDGHRYRQRPQARPLQGVRRQARAGKIRHEVRRSVQGNRGDQVSCSELIAAPGRRNTPAGSS